MWKLQIVWKTMSNEMKTGSESMQIHNFTYIDFCSYVVESFKRQTYAHQT